MGKSIQAKGITPDYLAEDPSDATDKFSTKIYESSYKNHLENTELNNKSDKPVKIVKISPENKKMFADKTSFEVGTKDDYQYVQAIKLLQGHTLETE